MSAGSFSRVLPSQVDPPSERRSSQRTGQKIKRRPLENIIVDGIRMRDIRLRRTQLRLAEINDRVQSDSLARPRKVQRLER
jgi:hypothetical protein